MKLKTKSIIILMITLFAVLLLGTTKVDAYTIAEAVVEKGEITKEFNIPDTFNLDIKMSEIEKAPKLILEQLENQLSEQGVKIRVTDFYEDLTDKESIVIDVASPTEMYIYVNTKNYNTDKKVKVIYNNSNNYNETDKKTIENALKSIPKENGIYIIEHYIEINNNYDIPSVIDVIIDKLNKTFNDNSIKVTRGSGGGAGGAPSEGDYLFSIPIRSGYECNFNIYKDDVYCTSIWCNTITKSKITVPSDIKDTESYAISKINEYLKAYNHYMSNLYEDPAYNTEINVTFDKLKKISGNNYKVYYKLTNGEQRNDTILIQQEKQNTPTTEDVKKEDTTTGLKLETTTEVLPSNVVLSSKEVTEQTTLDTVKTALKDISNKYTVYDINLLQNNAKVQPKGNVKIRIPVPSDYNKEKLEVYRVDENGEKTKYDVKVEDKYATFETNHFSTYVLAEKQEQNNVNTPTQNEETPKRELDETPKTGTIDITYIIMTVAVISGVGIIALRKKQK